MLLSKFLLNIQWMSHCDDFLFGMKKKKPVRRAAPRQKSQFGAQLRPRLRDSSLDLDSINFINCKVDFLNDVHKDIVAGTYFSSMDKIWEPLEVSFEADTEESFDRTYDTIRDHAEKGYKTTAEGACDTDNTAAGSSSRSHSTPSQLPSSAPPAPLDIFGVDEAGSESAH